MKTVKTSRWEQHTTTRIRLVVDAPLGVKDLDIARTLVEERFLELCGRTVQCDNDFWLESGDEVIAFVFELPWKNPASVDRG